MKITLNFLDRLAAINVLKSKPQADLDEWEIIDRALKVLAITKADIEYYEVHDVPGGSQWNKEKGEEKKDYEIDEDGYSLLRDRIKEMDAQKKIAADQVSLARIMLGRENDAPEPEDSPQGGVTEAHPSHAREDEGSNPPPAPTEEGK